MAHFEPIERQRRRGEGGPGWPDRADARNGHGGAKRAAVNEQLRVGDAIPGVDQQPERKAGRQERDDRARRNPLMEQEADGDGATDQDAELRRRG